MEKFILLFRGSDVYETGQSPEALQALTLKMLDWVGDLSKKGLHVASEKFQRTGRQVSGIKQTATDNPLGELKDIIGGCTMVLAKDIDQAIKIARACPILATNATIEVRPIQSV